MIDLNDLKQLTISAYLDKNDPVKSFELSTCINNYFENHGKQIDGDLVEWMTIHSTSNYIAQNNLGYMYNRGFGVATDYKLACELYQLSANQGYAFAQNNLGYMYHAGHGVPQDYKRACQLYQLATDQECGVALNNLGHMYQFGHGVPQDYKRACELYQLSANQGHAIAQYNLGHMYHYGKGVPKDHDKALMSYRLSIKQGNNDARVAIIELIRANPEMLFTVLDRLENTVTDLEEELTELRISAPIEGGPLYQEALVRFNLHRVRNNTTDEIAIVKGLDESDY